MSVFYFFLRVRIYEVGADHEVGDQPSSTVVADVWFHFAMTWSGVGNRFKVFINGGIPSLSTAGNA